MEETKDKQLDHCLKFNPSIPFYVLILTSNYPCEIGFTLVPIIHVQGIISMLVTSTIL